LILKGPKCFANGEDIRGEGRTYVDPAGRRDGGTAYNLIFGRAPRTRTDGAESSEDVGWYFGNYFRDGKKGFPEVPGQQNKTLASDHVRESTRGIAAFFASAVNPAFQTALSLRWVNMGAAHWLSSTTTILSAGRKEHIFPVFAQLTAD